MNIKQSPCMARIVAPGHPLSGWIVQVLRDAPLGVFDLPDGYPSAGEHGSSSWVCESLMHSPFECPLKNGRIRATRFAVIGDESLRPLRDNPGNESFVTEARKQLTGGKTEINARGELA